MRSRSPKVPWTAKPPQQTRVSGSPSLSMENVPVEARLRARGPTPSGGRARPVPGQSGVTDPGLVERTVGGRRPSRGWNASWDSRLPRAGGEELGGAHTPAGASSKTSPRAAHSLPGSLIPGGGRGADATRLPDAQSLLPSARSSGVQFWVSVAQGVPGPGAGFSTVTAAARGRAGPPHGAHRAAPSPALPGPAYRQRL